MRKTGIPKDNILTRTINVFDLYTPRYVDAPLNAVMDDDTIFELTPTQLRVLCNTIRVIKDTKDLDVDSEVIDVDSSTSNGEYNAVHAVSKLDNPPLTYDRTTMCVVLNPKVIAPRDMKNRVKHIEDSPIPLHPYTKHILNVNYYMSTELLDTLSDMTKRQRKVVKELFRSVDKKENTISFRSQDIAKAHNMPLRQVVKLIQILIQNNIMLPINSSTLLCSKSSKHVKHFTMNPRHVIKAVSKFAIYKDTYDFVDEVLNTETEAITPRVFEVRLAESFRLYKNYRLIEKEFDEYNKQIDIMHQQVKDGELPPSTKIPPYRSMTHEEIVKTAIVSNRL